MANIPVTTIDQEQTFFNSYFNKSMQINPVQYNEIFNFFRSRTGSRNAALSLTDMLIALTYKNNLDPNRMILEFQKSTDSSNYKKLMISFFNSQKGPTSKLGFRSSVSSNQTISRTILP
jgi:hypothetical protein